jgi:hypothetical protein
MAPYTTASGDELDTDLSPEDVVGKRIYNPTRQIGLGTAEKIVPNGYHNDEDAFKCRVRGGKTVFRSVDTIMQHLVRLDYELCDEDGEPVEEV